MSSRRRADFTRLLVEPPRPGLPPVLALSATQTSANSTTVEMLGMVTGQLAGTGLPDQVQQGVAMSYLNSVVTAQANMLGFQDGFFFLTLIAIGPLLPVMFLMRKRR